MDEPALRLTAHRLVFRCQTTTSLAMPQFAGAAIRGALITALRREICSLHGAGQTGEQDRLAGCPVCDFIAPVDAAAERGQDVPRLFTVEPPLEAAGLHPKDWSFSFGLTLFGQAATLFPYLAVAAQVMSQIGFGRRAQAPGHFIVKECWAIDPFGDNRERVMQAQSARLMMPPLPIDHNRVLYRAAEFREAYSSSPDEERVTIDFLTPARLIAESRLSVIPHFALVLRRILRRLSDLCDVAGAPIPTAHFQSLIPLAERVKIVENRTRWIDLSSYSSRTGRSTPIGGLMGTVVYEGELAPFLPWLVWGEVAHVGKDATKGNGWYRLTRAT